ncbi:amidase [Brevibacterium litoralis]|uniref:amidase n=1 Tax=Brevibacterium litoralis TaxID=3138935 RepID=UPI0032EEFDAB
MTLMEKSLTELSGLIRSGELSPVDLAQASLDRIAATEPAVTAFTTVTPDTALAQAVAAEEKLAGGEDVGPLHGIPFAAKDLYDTAGIPTTASSDQRIDYVPGADSTSVAKLQEAGMVLMGKTETHEFAYGALTPRSGNPWDPTRTPGGSSGGSGAAVGAGAVHVALGSDTGGSIRIPAALCGAVGLKPTFGRAGRSGVASLSWSLDHVGPLTRNVMDAALVMDAMSGFDPGDPGSVSFTGGDIADQAGASVAGLRVGVPTNVYTERLEAGMEENWRATLSVLEGMGAELVEVEIPYAEKIDATEWAIMIPEASAYHRTTMRTSPEKFTDEIRTFNEIGELVRAVDYIDALRMRTLMKQAWQEMYAPIDVLVAPTVAGTAVKRDDPVITYADGSTDTGTLIYVRLSAPANLIGLPALQVPNGTINGLPTGAQIIGRPFEEKTLVGVGLALEAATDHVGRIAPL